MSWRRLFNTSVNGSVTASFRDVLLFLRVSNEVDSVVPMRYCLTVNHHDPPPAAAAAVWLSELFHHGNRGSTARRHAETAWRGRTARTTVDMSPVDYGSIVDRVVDVNRVVRQVHLFPHWSIV